MGIRAGDARNKTTPPLLPPSQGLFSTGPDEGRILACDDEMFARVCVPVVIRSKPLALPSWAPGW